MQDLLSEEDLAGAGKSMPGGRKLTVTSEYEG